MASTMAPSNMASGSGRRAASTLRGAASTPYASIEEALRPSIEKHRQLSHEISKAVKGRLGSANVKQDKIYHQIGWEGMLQTAQRIKERFDGILAKLDGPGISVRTAPLKGQRGLVKANVCYGGDVSQLSDIVRATVEVSFELGGNADGAIKRLYEVLKNLLEAPEVHIVRFKDRFQEPMSGGYMDIQTLLGLDGFICELQLNLSCILAIKESPAGHGQYEHDRKANDDMFYAAMKHDAEEFKRCLALASRTDQKDMHGFQPLHYAAARGNVEIVSMLLDRGADPYAIDNGGLLPIHRAVLLSFGDVTKLLLSAMEAHLDGGPRHVDEKQSERLAELLTTSLERKERFGEDLTERLAMIAARLHKLSGSRRSVWHHWANAGRPFACEAAVGNGRLLTRLLPILGPADTEDDHGRTPFDACSLQGSLAVGKALATLGPGLGRGPASCASGPSELSYPTCAAALQDGGFLVADTRNHRILRFEPGATEGKLVAGMGAENSLSDLNMPTCVAPLQDGGFLVADSEHHCILRFEPGATEGKLMAGMGAEGSGLSELKYPHSIAPLQGGGFLVADTRNHRILRFEPGATEGKLVAGTGTAGTGLSELNYPNCVAPLQVRGFLVTDSGNHRILRFEPGATEGKLVAGTGAMGSGLSEFNKPNCVAPLQDGGFLVADMMNHRILCFEPGATEGKLVAGTGAMGSGLSELKYPYSVASLNDGGFLVADRMNHRILRFEPGATEGKLVAGTGAAGMRMAVSPLDYVVKKAYSRGSRAVARFLQELEVDCYVGIALARIYIQQVVKQGSAPELEALMRPWITIEPEDVPHLMNTFFKYNASGRSCFQKLWPSYSNKLFEEGRTEVLRELLGLPQAPPCRLESNWGPSALRKANGMGIHRIVDKDGFTLLHEAARSGDIISVKRFIMAKMPVNVMTSRGRTPLDDTSAPAVRSLLRQAGARENGRAATQASQVTGTLGYGLSQFRRPISVAPLQDGGFLVADSGNRRILRFEPGATEGEFMGHEVSEHITCIAPLQDGGFLVADGRKHCILRFEPGATEGKLMAGTGAPGARLSDLDGPNCVAPLQDGGFLVADTQNHRILRFEPGAKKGKLVAGTGTAGSRLSELDEPRSIAPLQDGGFLVADMMNHRILRFEPGATEGKLQAGTGVFGSGLSELNYPSCVAPLQDGGFLAADFENHRILHFEPGATEGKLVAGTGAEGSGLSEMHNPTCVAPLQDGGFLVADFRNDRILRFEPGATKLVAGTGAPGCRLSEFNEPYSVAPLQDGGFLVADARNHRILHFKPGATEGKLVAGTGAQGSGFSELNYPSCIAPLQDGGFLVADPENHRILRFEPGAIEGKLMAGTGAEGSGLSELNYPICVAPLQDSGFLVTDSGNHRILRFEPGATEGKLVAGTGAAGTGLSELKHPNCIAPLQDGGFLVAELQTNRILRFEPGATEGKLVAGTGAAGSGLSELDDPKSIAPLQGGGFLVADSGNHRILRFEPGATEGKVVAGTGAAGSGLSELKCPMCVAPLQDGSLLVADCENHRILHILSSEGLDSL